MGLSPRKQTSVRINHCEEQHRTRFPTGGKGGEAQKVRSKPCAGRREASIFKPQAADGVPLHWV